MDSSNLAWYFRQLVFNAWYGRFQYRELYTRSSLIGGLISGLTLGDVTTGIMVGVALQVVYIAFGNTWWYRICRCACHLYIGVPLAILFVHANNITDEAGIAAAAAPIGAAVGTIGTVLFTVPLLWTWFGNTLVGKPLKKETSKNSTQLTGFTPDLSLPSSFPSNNDYHQIRWKHGWFDETIPSYGWLLDESPLQSVLFSMCRYCILLKQIITEATDFIPFFVGFTFGNLSDWTWHPVPLFH